jgi:hypothetical protein
MMIAHRFRRLDDHRLGRPEALSSAGHRIGLIRGKHKNLRARGGRCEQAEGACPHHSADRINRDR